MKILCSTLSNAHRFADAAAEEYFNKQHKKSFENFST